MRSFFILICVAFFCASDLNAQINIAGIYKSHTDFLSQKLTHYGKNTKMKMHEIFKKELVEVKFEGATFVYRKDEIYGFMDHEQFTYRFFNEKIYPILNPGEDILIYRIASGAGTKNSPVQDSFFFSKNDSSEIIPFTLFHLESAYSNDNEFGKLIEIYFRKDDELIEYDYIHHMYKLNRLFELSRKKIDQQH